MSASNNSSPVVASPAVQSQSPPQESFIEKGLRKCKDEPLVPLGALATTAFLTAGFRAFIRGESNKAQVFMRGRVLAQGFTVAAMCVGAFFGLKPVRKPHIEETLLAKDKK